MEQWLTWSSSKMSNEILQLKPNLYGVGIDLKALTSPAALLAALTPEILDRTAQLFGIRRAWLEGVDDRLYELNSCYKWPSVLLDDLVKCQAVSGAAFVKIITSAKNLDHESAKQQALVLIWTEELLMLDEESIERFHVYGDSWDWSYSPCRIQLKAMARLVFQRLHHPVPIYRVSHADLTAIGKGRRIPSALLRGCLLTDPSMEDFGLSPEESAVAKEVDELPEVLAYIEREGLASRLGEQRSRPA
jgi:hypothetical protein